MIKRKWWFLQPPSYFQMKCKKCGETEKLQWSEFENYIWCETCNEDISKYESPMDGPTPIHLATIMMDMRVVDDKDQKIHEYLEYFK